MGSWFSTPRYTAEIGFSSWHTRECDTLGDAAQFVYGDAIKYEGAVWRIHDNSVGKILYSDDKITDQLKKLILLE